MKSRTAEKNSDQLKQLYAKNPDSLLFSRIADLYRKEGDIKRAIGLCQKGLDAHPEYVTGHIILGRCYIEQENYDSAIDEFISVCKIDRRNHVAIKMLADIFVKKGETEKAGDLYRILTELDPFDTSFKILSSRFDTTGKSDLLDILDAQENLNASVSNMSNAPQARNSTESYSANQISDDILENGEVLDNGSMDQMVTTFTDDEMGSNNNDRFGVSGADIDSRMNTLFGEEEQKYSDPAMADDNKANFSTFEDKNPVLESVIPSQPVSGSDISNRIDELFDVPDSSSNIDSDGMQNTGKSGITEKIFFDSKNYNDKSDVLSEQFRDDTAVPDNSIITDQTASHDLSELQDNLQDNGNSFSDNIIPFSNTTLENDVVSDEFEETLQFDRSMFSRLNEEPDYEELTSSGSFMSMGKTEELDQDFVDTTNQRNRGDDVNVNVHDNADDASVQYQLQSLNYSSENDVTEDSLEKNSIEEDLHLNSPLSTVSEDTVFHGHSPFGEVDLEDSPMADDDEKSPGFLSSEHFADKFESIFNDESNKTDDIFNDSQAGKNDVGVPDIPNTSDALNIDDDIEQLRGAINDDSPLEMPDFESSDLLSEISDELTEDEKNGSRINAANENIDREISNFDSEIISSKDDLMLLQADDSVTPDISDPILPGDDSQREKSGSSSSSIGDFSEDFDIFNEMPTLNKDLEKPAEDDDSGYILENATGEENVVIPEIFDNNEVDQNLSTDDSRSVEENAEFGDISISDTGIILSEPITDLGAIDDSVNGTGPELLLESGSDDIIVDNDDAVVSDMDVLVISPENQQMTGDDVAEKIQDIFDLGASKEPSSFSNGSNSIGLIEDDEELILDQMSTSSDQSAMIDLSEETFVEQKSGFFSDDAVEDRYKKEPPNLFEKDELVLDGPEEPLVVSAYENLNSELDFTEQKPSNSEENNVDPQSDELIQDNDSIGSLGKHPEVVNESGNRISNVSSEVISGLDVEERLEEFFGKDLLDSSFVNDLIPEDEEAEETLIQDFYTVSGENTATASGNENLEGVDNVELDQTDDFVDEVSSNDDVDKQPGNNSDSVSGLSDENEMENLFVNHEQEKVTSTSLFNSGAEIESDILLPEMVDEENAPGIRSDETDKGISLEASDSGNQERLEVQNLGRFSAADLFENENHNNFLPIDSQSSSSDKSFLQEIDERDKPYNIPDHVLTPTLADIYFQQGQYQLALQIYSRLLEKDPDNDRLQNRIIEIKTCIEQNPHENNDTHGTQSKHAGDYKHLNHPVSMDISPKNNPRPLAGVRIPKKKKLAKKAQKKKE
jgi:tetratricopeptide (TPR) repeat protein